MKFTKCVLQMMPLPNQISYGKSDNLQYSTLGRWVDCLINQASDGPSIILIDWK